MPAMHTPEMPDEGNEKPEEPVEDAAPQEDRLSQIMNKWRAGQGLSDAGQSDYSVGQPSERHTLAGWEEMFDKAQYDEKTPHKNN